MEFLVFFFRFFALQLGFLVVFVVFLTFAGEIKKKKPMQVRSITKIGLIPKRESLPIRSTLK